MKRTEQSSLSQDHECDPDVHRISHATVQRGGYEEPCRSNRRRRAQPADCEFPGAAEINGSATCNEDYARPA